SGLLWGSGRALELRDLIHRTYHPSNRGASRRPTSHCPIHCSSQPLLPPRETLESSNESQISRTFPGRLRFQYLLRSPNGGPSVERPYCRYLCSDLVRHTAFHRNRKRLQHTKRFEVARRKPY